MAYSGKFIPKNPDKYRGDPSNVIYRSLWEFKLMKYLDDHKQIVRWSSEEFCIPYVSPKDNRVHRYYPDYLIKVKENNNKIKSYVVEVKPKKQTLPPKPRKRVTKSYIYECQTYAVNQAKWKAADEFCKDNRIEFKIITEKELGIK